jgi:hypothetical protein
VAVEVEWDGGQLKPRWVVSRTALWSTPKWPPVALRFGRVGDPEGQLRRAACFCTDLQATTVQVVPWVVRRWAVAVTCAEGRAPLGLETQRQWSDQAIARTTPVLWALFSIVTLLALRLRQGEPIPGEATAWDHQPEPTLVDCLALVPRHLWRAQYVVNSAADPERVQFPRKVFERWLTGLPLAA